MNMGWKKSKIKIILYKIQNGECLVNEAFLEKHYFGCSLYFDPHNLVPVFGTLFMGHSVYEQDEYNLKTHLCRDR